MSHVPLCDSSYQLAVTLAYTVFNQSINQSINQSTNQPINQSINDAITVLEYIAEGIDPPIIGDTSRLSYF